MSDVFSFEVPIQDMLYQTTMGMGTKKLFLDDSEQTEFTARVVAHRFFKDRSAILLDQTAFYPEGGGQGADQGFLGGLPVLDVQIDAQGDILHVLEGALPAIDSLIEGRIDPFKRRQQNANHSGQHLLSGAFFRQWGAQTVSSRLGTHDCTIDLDLPSIDQKPLEQTEELVNQWIETDAPIQTFEAKPEELHTLGLRKDPKVFMDIRIVAIGNFDRVACGGTHCKRTSQVGWLVLLGSESLKSLTRIHFMVGAQARKFLKEHFHALRDLGQAHSSAPLLVPALVAKLKKEKHRLQQALALTQKQLGEKLASGLLANSVRPVVWAEIPRADMALLREIGKIIILDPSRAVVLLGASADGCPLLAMRGKKSEFDCGLLVQKATVAYNGRGGGGSSYAEGLLPANANLQEIIQTYSDG